MIKNLLRLFVGFLAVFGLINLVYSAFYATRWVLTGVWVQGGGDRCFAGVLLGLLSAVLMVLPLSMLDAMKD